MTSTADLATVERGRRGGEDGASTDPERRTGTVVADSLQHQFLHYSNILCKFDDLLHSTSLAMPLFSDRAPLIRWRFADRLYPACLFTSLTVISAIIKTKLDQWW
ncbi:unnamed protein product [Nippostrongylus brasiliensis]|uniref:Uncharacterized protein n=1 Tax=Nippostrongylus brasiliensis TaxID=27835 RepID=A0A0N4YFD3_NIPBR|nr:unnamed protein product [Nippostrongylus brasiliensis]